MAAKFTSIDQAVGQIYKMCKDQHGCRFLQKQLEEGGRYVVQVVFLEIYDHIVELMTGFYFPSLPFSYFIIFIYFYLFIIIEKKQIIIIIITTMGKRSVWKLFVPKVDRVL